jgi:CDP-diacylglycerol--serine O-phosphatidyltransferase
MAMMQVMVAGMMHGVMRNPMVMSVAGGSVTLLSHRGPGNNDQRRGQYSFLQHNNSPTAIGDGLFEKYSGESSLMARAKSFSMIREFRLADWFTLGNAICGTAALFSTISYVQSAAVEHIYFASALVFAALIFDILDGRVARWRQTDSAMGRELDSLADVISFGVTPAMIGYACGMQGLYDRIILGYFVACGVSRLARYNVTAEEMSAGSSKVKFFEGTPIPTSFLLVCVLALAAWLERIGEQLWFGEVAIAGHVLHPLTLLFAVSGSLMISRLRIPKI